MTRLFPNVLVATLGALTVWLVAHHLALGFLWGDAAREMGLWLLMFLEFQVMFPFLLIVLVAMAGRVWRRHPDVLASLRWTTASSKLGAFLFLVAIYGGVVFVGGWIEHAMAFHFVTSIGIYCLHATLAAGVIYAGERWPFRGLVLHPVERGPVEMRRVWIADALSLGLGVLLVASFVLHKPFSYWEYGLEILPQMAFQTLDAVGGVLLGWALLHSHLFDVVRWGIARCEAMGRARGEASLALGAGLREVSAHGMAVLVVILAMRVVAWGIAALRARDWWIVSSDDTVFLWIDWYWVATEKWFGTGSLFLVAGFVVVVFAVLRAVERRVGAWKPGSRCGS